MLMRIDFDLTGGIGEERDTSLALIYIRKVGSIEI